MRTNTSRVGVLQLFINAFSTPGKPADVATSLFECTDWLKSGGGVRTGLEQGAGWEGKVRGVAGDRLVL